MEGALQIFDELVAGFLAAIATGVERWRGMGSGSSVSCLSSPMSVSLAQSSPPGSGSLSDALGTPLLYFLMVGGYFYVLVNLIPMTAAALNTAIGWGLEMSGGGLSADLVRTPSFIVQVGLDLAKPIAQFDTIWNAIKSTIGMAARPQNLLVFWSILLSFMASASTLGSRLLSSR